MDKSTGSLTSISGSVFLLTASLWLGSLCGPDMVAASEGHFVALPPQVNSLDLPSMTDEEILELMSGAAVSALYGNPDATGEPPDVSSVFPGVGRNIVVNNRGNDTPTNFTQSETSIAVSGQNIVEGYNDFSGPTALSGYSFSSDGGRTFTQGATLFNAGSPRGDPSIVTDNAGVFYYGFLDAGNIGGQPQSGLTVSFSNDGGQTFPTGSFFGAGNSCDFLDKEHIAVLTSSTAPGGPQIVMSYTRFIQSDPFNLGAGTCPGPQSSQVEVVVVNPNTGAVIQGPVVIGSGSGSVPRVDSQGRIFVAWENRNGDQVEIVRSDDGGATYTALAATPTVISAITDIGFDQMCGNSTRKVLNGGFRVNNFPTMDIDTSGGLGNDNIYVAWNDAVLGDADILMCRSTDGGNNWSTPIRINDDAIGNGADQFFPWLTVDPNGQVGIIFMDRRLDPNNLLIDVFHCDSHNQGQGFTTNSRVTEVSHLPVVNVQSNVAPCYMSDYNYADSDANHIYASWSDNRQGDPDAYFAKLHLTQEIQVNADLDFGTICTEESRLVQIFNAGDLDLLVTSVAFTAGSNPGFSVDPDPIVPVVIQPGAEMDFTVRFTPSTPGVKTGTLRITSDDPGRPVVDLAATCTVGEGDIRVTGSTDFGEVCAGTIVEKTISVCNVGACNLDVASVGFNPACDDFTLVNNPFPAPVSPDACLDVVIRFTPLSAGNKSCTLEIASNDPDSPVVSVTVTASTPLASIDVPEELAFPPTVVQDQGDCPTFLPFPISNTGNCNLEITGIQIGGENASDYSLVGLPSFPIILEPGHTAGDGDLRVAFEPSELDRDRVASITVEFVEDPFSGALSTETALLCGEGVKTGARVLVLYNGVPVDEVEMIKIRRVNANANRPDIRTVEVARDLPLELVTPAPPCLPFQYHREYGTVSNPEQLLPGAYEVTATIRVSNLLDDSPVWKVVGFDVHTCEFNPQVVVEMGDGSAPLSSRSDLTALMTDKTGISGISPDPFNHDGTTVLFNLGDGQPRVRIGVYDLSGRLIRTLVDTEVQRGAYEVDWDARDENGRRVPSGMYFFRLTTNTSHVTKKALLVR